MPMVSLLLSDGGCFMAWMFEGKCLLLRYGEGFRVWMFEGMG